MLCGSGLPSFYLYKYTIMAVPPGSDKPVATEMRLRAMDHYPLLLIAVVMTLMPLISIFMFNNRKRQISLSIVNLLATCSFITMMLAQISKITPAPVNGSYGIGAILPAVELVFTVLAIFGIRRDEKLVKSMDRLR